MSRDDGGAAFPRPFSKVGEYSDSTKEHAQAGMTLLDYFAANAMQGTIAAMDSGERNYTPPETIAKNSYDMARAMLAARVKP